MEKLNLTKNTTVNKKVFLRKEIEANRLGEEIYSDEVLSQYSVYLIRKFELSEDYEQPEQFEALLTVLPEEFNHEFEDCVAKNLYVRMTQKAVYVTLLLALAHPLSKLQISDLRTWISSLEVPELPLEHVSSVTEEVPLEMIKGLQETNSEVLLLTEMMNQFSENLNDVYKEVQSVKDKRTPPVVKVIQSKVAAKEALESENAQKLTLATKKITQLAEEFSLFKAHVNNKLATIPKPKIPPKFKITFGSGEESGPTMETRLEDAIKRIDALAQELAFSDQKVKELNKTIDKNKQVKRPKLNFSIAKKTIDEQSKLADKLATTNEEVITIGQQLQQINDKLNVVESTVETKSDAEALARIEKDHGQLQETASETVKLNQVINQLTMKLQTVETELTTIKNEKKKVPTVRLTKSDSAKKLAEQHQKDQEQLKSNATEIKKLTQTVGKVDIQLIKAHQKIAELEQKMRQTTKAAPIVKQEQAPIVQQTPVARTNNTIIGPPPAVKPTLPTASQQKPSVQESRSFPSKEAFLQANRPTRPMVDEERPTVTLAIEEMLDRVSEKHPQTVGTRSSWALEDGYNQNSHESEEAQGLSLRHLKKLEWDIHSFFQQGRGMGHKGMMPKDSFYANIRKIEVLPYLWASVYEREKKDILLGNELSSQQLIDDLNDFLEEVEILSKKRKVMGKWIYCPKEVEQKMEGYKLLSEYLEAYLARQNEG